MTERDEERRRVTGNIRQAIWQMHDAEDLGQVLAAIRQGLEQLHVPAEAWGVNVVLDQTDPPQVRTYSMDDAGNWTSLQSDSIIAVMSFWMGGRVVYRPDVTRDDPYDEARHFFRMRCVVDVPFSHGTLAVSTSVANAFDETHISVLQDMAQLLEDGFRRTDELRSLAARHLLREEVWKMQGQADLQRLMATVRTVLVDLGFSFHACGINLIDVATTAAAPRTELPQVRSHDLTSDGDWLVHETRETPSFLVQLWRQGRTAYRRDLVQTDMHNEREELCRAHGADVRCVVDVPFAHGTLALNSTRPGAFSDAQIEMLQELVREIEEGFRRLHDLRTLEARNEALEREVREREQAEASLSIALQDKDALLKEIHHRVKNNLQLVSSLLNLQSSGATDPQLVARLDDSRARVESMALLHEQLYSSQDLAHIDGGAYLRLLVTNLGASLGASGRVEIQHNIEPLNLDADRALQCGLIVNELVSNALKHAFPDGASGAIQVEFRRLDGEILLRIADDGVGLPPDVDIGRSWSLGLQLVMDFSRQLQARVELDRTVGTDVRLWF